MGSIMADKLPMKFREYTLVKVLGHGSEGDVFLATHDHKEGNFVVKVFRKGKDRIYVDTKQALYRLLSRTMSVFQLIDHPHLVYIEESGTYEGFVYIVMKYIEDGSLRDLLDEKEQIPINDALDYGCQVAAALSCMHQSHIIHRDIKPDNIFLDKDGKAMVGDVGISTVLREGKQLEKLSLGLGSPGYMPPEQESNGPPRPESDQYALGVTIYELITGKRPQDEKDWADFAARYPKIAPVLKKACASAWQERYQTMDKFSEALTQVKQSQLPNVNPDQTTNPVPPHPSSQITTPLSSLTPTSPLPNTPQHWFQWARMRVGVFLLLLIAIALGGGIVGWSLRPVNTIKKVTLSTSSVCFQTVTTLLNDGGTGSLRQELKNISHGQSCVISFASSVNGDLTLNSPLTIDQNVIIEVPSKNQVTITPKTPQVAITIEAGYRVLFQNLSFTGLGQENPAQPDAFIQIDSANVTFTHCDISNFYSDGDGGALSNKYGNLTLEETTLKYNKSNDYGGAVYNLGLASTGEGTLILDGSKLDYNTANYRGGSVYNLGGSVLVDGGSMDSNNTLYNDDEIEGGAAIASWDGVLSISGTTFSQNTAQGYGGGILLVGTNAQISFSQFQTNKTEYTSNRFIQVHGEGGGIAAETDRDNNDLSNLDLIGDEFQNNSNSFPGNDPSSTNDVAGGSNPNCSTPPCESITITTPQPPSPSAKNLLGYLRIDDFTQFCQSKLPLTSAAPATPEDGTIVCLSPNSPPEPFANVEQKKDIQSAVQVLCQSHWPRAVNVLARLFDYWDPLSWQCFENEQPLGQNVTRDDINNSFCSKVYPGSTATLLGGTSLTAYDWSCQLGLTFYRIKMDTVCQKRTGGNPSAISALNPENFYNINDWLCFGDQPNY